MMAAQAVPWPTRSSCGPSRSTYPSSADGSSSNATPPAMPPTRGCSASTPLSTTATFTPAPVAPPNAHSRTSSIGRPTTSSSDPRSNAPDQAGVAVIPVGRVPRPATTRRGGARRSPAAPAAVGSAAAPGVACMTRRSGRRWCRGRCSVQSLDSSTTGSSTDSTPSTSPSGIEHRGGVDRGRHVVGRLGHVAGEPGVGLDVAHRDRLARHRRPAGDPAADRDRHTDDLVGARSVRRDELERAPVVVDQRDRARGGAEESARGFDAASERGVDSGARGHGGTVPIVRDHGCRSVRLAGRPVVD